MVNEAINFYKNTFLQKISEEYTFQSHQLFQVVLGIQLFRMVRAGEIFHFKSEVRTEWRVLSFAGAIARKKGSVETLTPYYTKVLKDLLASRINTAMVAALLDEVRSKPLSVLYINLVKKLDFRPLLLWSREDSTVPKAYARIIKHVGKPGFDWFFENYLNPKHPVRDGLEDIATETLRSYIAQNGFQLTVYENELIKPVISVYVKTFNHSIVYLFPVLVLAMPEEFDIKKRCILLAEAMETNPEKAKSMLMDEWEKGLTHEVIDGLRIICSKRNQNLSALKLLLTLSGEQIAEDLLHIAVRAAAGDEEVFEQLSNTLEKNNLFAYLRCCAIFQNNVSDSASLLLYKYFDERELSLLGEPLVLKTQWFDFKNLERETILNELVFATGDKGIDFITANIPVSESDHGLPEAYTRLFLKSLIASQNSYVNEFLSVVRNLGKFSLSRYPEIRHLFAETLKKPEYYLALTSRLDGLDSRLRYNAACILLVCNPEGEMKAMAMVIRSAYMRLNDNQEWLRLCMKLNYRKTMLDFIVDLLKELTDTPRIFALTLLYHNKQYALNDELTAELLVGLTGDGGFLEWSGGLLSDGIEKVTAKDKFYDFFLKQLYVDDFKVVQSVANTLITYHSNKLSTRDLAKCWLFYIVYFDHGLNEFHQSHRTLLNNTEFTDALKIHVKECAHLVPGGSFLLYNYYQIIYEEGSWITFFYTLQDRSSFMHKDELQYFYDTIKDLGDSNTAIGIRLGTDMAELMTYPAHNQKQDNYIIPQIAIFAHEFNGITTSDLDKVLKEYHINMPDVAASLLFRLGKIPQEYSADRIYEGIIPFFQSISSIKPNKFIKADLEKYLTDGPAIPNNFVGFIEWVLLEDIFSSQELSEIAPKSNLSAYFKLIIAYCRNDKVDIPKLRDAEEIGFYWSSRQNNNQLYRQVLLRVKDILLSDQHDRKDYVKSLVDSIGKENMRDSIEIIVELLILEEKFDTSILIKLFFAFLNTSGRMNLQTMNLIFMHVNNILAVPERLTLVAPLQQCLKSLLATNSDREGDTELLSWTFSLLPLFIDGKQTAETESGFLTGLKSIFIQDGQHYQSGNDTLKFKGRDLLAYSDVIFSQIETELMSQIVKTGLKSNVPEISTLCKVLSAFNRS